MSLNQWGCEIGVADGPTKIDVDDERKEVVAVPAMGVSESRLHVEVV